VIERGIRKVTSTAVIKVPMSAVIVDRDGGVTATETARAIKRGDAVRIELWYEGFEAHKEIWQGWVKRVNYAFPAEIDCDDMLPLRNKGVQQSWKKVTIEEVVKYLVSGTGIVPVTGKATITLEPYTIEKGDAAFALQKLCDNTGMTAYMRPDGRLWCGLAYEPRGGDVKLTISGAEVNVVDAKSLKYHLASETRLKVKAISINGNNSRIEATVGDGDGVERTLHFYNIKTKAELEKAARAEMQKYKFDGYEGKINTKLIPLVLPGMSAAIVDPKFERGGKYYVESTRTTFDTSGATREVAISIKLDNNG
jgi:hypothetical protein